MMVDMQLNSEIVSYPKTAHLTETVEYADCTSAEGLDLPPITCVLGKVSVLEPWGI